MMYPFLSAILPALNPAQVPDITVAEFDALAEEHLPAKLTVKMRSWDDPSKPAQLPVYTEVRRFMACMNYRIAVIRAEKLKLNADFEVPENLYGEIDYALASAVKASPADREKLLDAALWYKLDDLEIGHEMDFEHLCIYRIRLAVLQKYAVRGSGNAVANFEAALDKLAQKFNEP